MKSVAVDHGKRIESLEMAVPKDANAAVIMPTVAEPEAVPVVTMPIIASRPLPKDAARQRKRPLLPIELPQTSHTEAVKIEAFGRSVNDPTDSISRKYMNADQLHAAKKSTRL